MKLSAESLIPLFRLAIRKKSKSWLIIKMGRLDSSRTSQCQMKWCSSPELKLSSAKRKRKSPWTSRLRISKIRLTISSRNWASTRKKSYMSWLMRYSIDLVESMTMSRSNKMFPWTVLSPHFKRMSQWSHSNHLLRYSACLTNLTSLLLFALRSRWWRLNERLRYSHLCDRTSKFQTSQSWWHSTDLQLNASLIVQVLCPRNFKTR